MVRLASVAGLEAIRRPGSGVAIRSAVKGSSGSTVLTALHREDAIMLRRLIARAAGGGTGGSLRIRASDADAAGDGMQVAVVSPLPAGASGGTGLALVKIEDLVRRAAPPAAMLCDLFGLSRTEADVALRLVGGASAEEVALSRSVALDTVRGQIRVILRKSEATNLRDFERLMATLAKIGVAAASPPRGMSALVGPELPESRSGPPTSARRRAAESVSCSVLPRDEASPCMTSRKPASCGKPPENSLLMTSSGHEAR